MNEEGESEAVEYRVRRATVEDLPQLKALWQAARMPVSELDKRFTEFQLAVDLAGRIQGGVGLQMQKQQGLIHSEVFHDPERAPEIRPVLWQRVLNVAKNNGLIRLWAQPTTAFYREQGMVDVDDMTRVKLPDAFGNPRVDWVTLKLKEENQNAISLEKEFEIFAQAQKAESERVMTQAKAFRLLAYGLLILAIIGLGAVAILAKRVSGRKR